VPLSRNRGHVAVHGDWAAEEQQPEYRQDGASSSSEEEGLQDEGILEPVESE